MKNDNENNKIDTPRLLKADELAVYLRVDRRAVYEAIRKGEIPGVVRIGKLFRISLDAVEAWLMQDPGIPSPRQ